MVPPVGSGRRRWIVAVVSVIVLGVVSAASLASADEEIFQKGKLRSDRVFTVGQPETIVIKRLSPRLKVRVTVTAFDTRCQAVKIGFCEPATATRTPGTPRFRTSGKGRAVLTFVMPAGYDFLHLKPPFKTEHMAFTNGEPLLVDAQVDTAVTRHGESRHLIGIAQGGAVAEVPPPTPAS
jgi:hypothetical protein